MGAGTGFLWLSGVRTRIQSQDGARAWPGLPLRPTGLCAWLLCLLLQQVDSGWGRRGWLQKEQCQPFNAPSHLTGTEQPLELWN